MRQTIAAVAVLLLAACPEVATGPQGPEGPQGPAGYSALASGTRIKARVGTTPDGAKLFLGWHDAELGVDCEFRPTKDWSTRCMPVGPYTNDLYFTDHSCTQAAVRNTLRDGSEVPSYIQVLAVQMNDWGKNMTVTSVRMPSGAATLGTLYAVRGSQGCMLDSSEASFIPLGDEEPLERFQVLTETIDD